jgi:adenylyl cyclase-associated protein
LTIEDGERNQTVNLYGCKKTTVVVKGKINAVTMGMIISLQMHLCALTCCVPTVNCIHTSVLVESIISSISVTSSPSFAVQVTGTVPTIQIDTTDTGTIYLSKDCLDIEITTAKCSSINVNVPVAGEEDGIYDECPVPEMLMTKVKDGKLVTSVVEHLG